MRDPGGVCSCHQVPMQGGRDTWAGLCCAPGAAHLLSSSASCSSAAARVCLSSTTAASAWKQPCMAACTARSCGASWRHTLVSSGRRRRASQLNVTPKHVSAAAAADAARLNAWQTGRGWGGVMHACCWCWPETAGCGAHTGEQRTPCSKRQVCTACLGAQAVRLRVKIILQGSHQQQHAHALQACRQKEAGRARAAGRRVPGGGGSRCAGQPHTLPAAASHPSAPSPGCAAAPQSRLKDPPPPLPRAASPSLPCREAPGYPRQSGFLSRPERVLHLHGHPVPGPPQRC